MNAVEKSSTAHGRLRCSAIPHSQSTSPASMSIRSKKWVKSCSSGPSFSARHQGAGLPPSM